jgi:hypothetical protein
MTDNIITFWPKTKLPQDHARPDLILLGVKLSVAFVKEMRAAGLTQDEIATVLHHVADLIMLKPN